MLHCKPYQSICECLQARFESSQESLRIGGKNDVAQLIKRDNTRAVEGVGLLVSSLTGKPNR
jgi:hypothetical protein